MLYPLKISCKYRYYSIISFFKYKEIKSKLFLTLLDFSYICLHIHFVVSATARHSKWFLVERTPDLELHLSSTPMIIY